VLETVLSGVRVIDLTQNVAGPFCTQILGDFGADVVKIERPGRGDDTRDWRPPEMAGQSATFLALNRNKRSVTVDLSLEEGRSVVRDLAAGADVLVHSLKPGTAERLGLGADALRTANPGLVYCAISAFGQTGPMSTFPGYDPLLQAFTGIMSVTGHEGDDPVRAGVSLIDMGTGLWAALGILAAIMNRARTGEGTVVEASLMDTGVSWMTLVIAGYLASGRTPGKMGSAIAMTAPYETFACADGHVFIAAGNDGLFARVCRGLGEEGLKDDPRFATNPDRVRNREALKAEIERLTRPREASRIVAALQAEGAPASVLNDVPALLDHPQLAAAGLVGPLPLPGGGGQHDVVATPLRLGGRRSEARAPAPALGEDTDAILARLGYPAERIAALRAAGALG